MGRFYQGFPWRFVVTNLNTEAVTCLERLAGNRTVVHRLNQPAMSTGQVPSDDRRINILLDEPGFDAPFLSFADRLLYGLRRETEAPSSWVCRFAGIVTQIEDAAQADQPYSNYTAFDPWQYLYKRGVKDGTGLVGPDGLVFESVRGDLIVQELLGNTVAVDGPAFFEIGDFEETAEISITFQQGTSVGDALRQLVATGSLDIEFAPVYDPAGKPGVCSTVNVYAQKGVVRDSAVFSWGRGRAVQQISSLLDGDQLANDVQFYNGQGGPPVTPATDPTSQGRYGVYTAQQFFPAQVQAVAVEAMAQLQLDLRKQGRRSVTISPNPLISPIPLLDYELGDRVPVYATNRLRQAIPWATTDPVYQRVYGIPITLGDDGIEKVERLVASPDGIAA